MNTHNILSTTIVLLGLGSTCFAGSFEELAEENAELRRRIQTLEQEMKQLKQMVLQNSKAQHTVQQPQTKTQATHQLNEADLQKILAMVQKNIAEKKPVWSNLDIQLYGYIKADASYDTSRTTSGNYVVYVDSEAANKNDDEFNLTVNQTRLGMKITGPDDDQVKTSGLVEVDFYGNYAAENKAKIQLRHAYLRVDWPHDKFAILAGQTSDVMSPLNPYTLNYTVLWDAGNIGYRRPQMRLTKCFALDSDVGLQLEAAVARNIGRSDLTGSESGEDAGFPCFQGRTSLTFPWFGPTPTTVGVSGHWAQEEYDITAAGKHKDFDSWSVNLDMTQPINEQLAIKAELFTGENLNTYFGGIGQGVNTTTLKEIGSKGGWVAASLGPWGKWQFNIGAGIDDVDAGDVNAGDRTLNRAVFGNVIYSINDNVQIGFELSQWHTRRKGQRDADNLRAQTSLIYKF